MNAQVAEMQLLNILAIYLALSLIEQLITFVAMDIVAVLEFVLLCARDLKILLELTHQEASIHMSDQQFLQMDVLMILL